MRGKTAWILAALVLAAGCGVQSGEALDPSPTSQASVENSMIPDAQTAPGDEERPAYTREEYDELRKRLPEEPFRIDYEDLIDPEGYLNIDPVAGRLEEYLQWALMGYREIGEVPDVLQDENLLFQSACFCTRGFQKEDYEFLHDLPGGYSLTPKEHVDRTARYLFGDACVIDYDTLESRGYYEYLEDSGMAFRLHLAKEGLRAVVVDYTENEDEFAVTAVFLTVHKMLLPEYDYTYVDETAQTNEERYTDLTRETAQTFCRSDIPDKYRIRLEKGEGERVYLRSIGRIAAETAATP